ncbi:MAG: pyridoxine 5'-phosphate synthase [Crocinitomix sp.]|nr:pyridoxine 5'-phosphate synthase [Crocinitomix sp.]
MGTKLSVNINKIATIRNARGGNTPNVVQVAIDCELFGADGITVHPRPDERHITHKDVIDLNDRITTEFNIEGYPNERFMELLRSVRPAQATLVPDPPDVLTSNAGWDTVKEAEFLRGIISEIKSMGIRTSLFIETDAAMIQKAAELGADRIEFYTGPYADLFETDKEKAIAPYREAAKVAHECNLGINAGHDLNLKNLRFFKANLPHLAEVSIGHALISDALYLGLENAVMMYKRELGS